MNNQNIDPDLPIGLFDSGVGGLTVLKAIREAMPRENFLYLGDNARLPYGSKSPATITRYALQAANLLVRRKIKLLVIACNTASAIALDILRDAYPQIPVLGVVEPGAQAACTSTRSGLIAVIGTESTIRGKAYQRAIAAINPQAKVIAKACPLFVPMAEEGLVAGLLPRMVAEHYLNEIFATGSRHIPDTLVLACTHFPLLKETIAEVIETETDGAEINVVDSAYTTAQEVSRIFEQGICPRARNLDTGGQVRYLTTDDVQPFVRLGGLFMGAEISAADVEMVDL